MFYRVDYILAILAAGFLIGVLLSRALQQIPSPRLARFYYFFVVILLVVRAALFAASLLITGSSLLSHISGQVGDLSGLLFGALLGSAVRRSDARQLLTEPAIVDALRMTVAFTTGILAFLAPRLLDCRYCLSQEHATRTTDPSHPFSSLLILPIRGRSARARLRGPGPHRVG